MNKLITSLTIISVIFYGCGNSSNKQSNNSSEASEHSDNHHNGADNTLQLNAGEKWVVNEEMKPFVKASEELLNKYLESQSQDYLTLATQLKENNDKLIKSCTMKGESHDELHKWLHPHIELIESLSKAKTVEQADKIIAEIQTSFITYNQYFK